MRHWRAYRETRAYPAYTRTSWNLERRGYLNGPRTTIHLSFQINHRYADRGFWIGFRPEIEVHRYDDRLKALGENLKYARVLRDCWRCGREEWTEPGDALPEGWDFVHMLEFCGECLDSCTVSELKRPLPRERNNA